MEKEFDYGWLRMAFVFTVLFCILAFFDMILNRGWFETIMAGLAALWIISIFWTVVFNFKFIKNKIIRRLKWNVGYLIRIYVGGMV